MNTDYGTNVSRGYFMSFRRGDTFILNGETYLVRGVAIFVDAENAVVLPVELPGGEQRYLKVTDFPLNRDEEINSCLEYLAYNNWRKTKEGPSVIRRMRDYLQALYDPNATENMLQQAWEKYCKY